MRSTALGLPTSLAKLKMILLVGGGADAALAFEILTIPFLTKEGAEKAAKDSKIWKKEF